MKKGIRNERIPFEVLQFDKIKQIISLRTFCFSKSLILRGFLYFLLLVRYLCRTADYNFKLSKPKYLAFEIDNANQEEDHIFCMKYYS